MRRVFAVLVTLVLVALGLTACLPPPPVPTFTVDTTADGPDAAPGNGVCADAGGHCTLAAAVQEGNALHRADLVVPDGAYAPSGGLIVTGDVRINTGHPHAVFLVAKIEVAARALLSVEGVAYGPAVPSNLSVSVDGTFLAKAVQLNLFSQAGQALHVGPTGVAIIETSSIIGALSEGTILNEGHLVLSHSTVTGGGFQSSTQPDPVIGTTDTGLTEIGTTWIAPLVLPFSPLAPNCGGSPTVSHGYNFHFDATCGTPTATDINTGYAWSGENPPTPLRTNPVVDAIPIGVAGCGTTSVTDLFGAPRPADGNGDGTPACDIGAVELPPIPT